MLKNCTVWIELEKDDDPTYEAGETVCGTVHVEVTEDCTCEGLTLELEWFTHGRGDTATERVHHEPLYEGSWTAGEHYTYPFKLTLPPGPYTYHGKYLNVDWRLRATADSSWSLDSEGKRELVLEPSGTEDDFNAGDGVRTWASTDGGRSFSADQLLVGAGFLGGGLLVFFVSGGGGVRLFGGIAAVIGAVMLYHSIQNGLAEMSLEEVNVELSTTEVSPGDTVRCRVEVRSEKPVQLKQITVWLMGTEHVLESNASPETPRTHSIHQSQVVCSGSERAQLNPGAMRSFQADIEIPESVPFSFRKGSDKIRWEIAVHVGVSSWPAWTHREPLVVRPSAS